MITGIAIENFKGIRERVEILLHPITLLFGANSAGKSSVLHAFHFAREIFERHNLDPDETISGGTYIDLGGFEGLVHGRDRNQSVRLRIDLSLDHHGLPDFAADFDTLAEAIDIPLNSFLKELRTVGVEVAISWSDIEERPYVSQCLVFLDNVHFAEILSQPNLRNRAISTINVDHPSLITVGESRDDGDDTPELFDNESLLSIALKTIGPEIAPGNGQQIHFSGRGDALPGPENPLPYETTPFSPSGYDDEDLELARKLNTADHLVRAISELVLGPCQLVRDHLKQFRYLGPLRETPSRNYHPPRYQETSRWASGLGAWDAIENGTDAFVGAVSDWLGDDDKLSSGYRIERRSYRELDLGDPLIAKLLSGRAFDEVDVSTQLDLTRLKPQRRIVIIPNGTNLELRPHDVGIGISQVVPVVAIALDRDSHMVAIEQPELHLHPKLQAELADLFIDQTVNHGKQFIIETHSEHFILRLLRRIRETESERALPEKMLRTDDLGIYYLKQADGSTKESRIEVDVNGDFIQPWPDDFFEIDFFERFPDAR